MLEKLPLSRPSDELQRLFHGRGHCYPGLEWLTIDWLAPAVLVTQFKPVDAAQRQQMLEAIKPRINAWDQDLCLVWQDRSVSPATTELLQGTLPESHWGQEQGLWFELNLMRGQNHGIFLDMAAGRSWVREHSKDRKVLNLFAYTCAFSVFAKAGGATEVVNLDMSKPALSQGKRNHARNDLTNGVRYLGHDLFKTFGKLRKLGPFDLVIVDPPSFQQGSFIATKDYPRLLRRLPELVSDGGEVLLCLNAPELGRDFLRDQVTELAPSLVFEEQIDNPATFEEQDPDRGLKVLRFRKH